MDKETAIRLAVLRALYAAFTREFYFRTTGKESTYGLSGREFQLWGGEREGRRYESPIRALDRYLEERQYDPELYMGTVFRFWTGSKPPMVNQLISEQARHMYKRFDLLMPERLKRTLRAYDEAYLGRALIHRASGKPPEEACLLAILDPDLEMSALYRFCILTENNYDKLAAKYRSTAILEYSPLRQHYDKVWSSIIPASLKEAARNRIANLGAR